MEELNKTSNAANLDDTISSSESKSDLGGYDLVLSMSNKGLNQHLSFHHRARHLPRKISVQNPITKSNINGDLQAPKLEFWTNDSNPTTESKVSLVIVFGRNTTFLDETGHEHKIESGSTLGFFVDIGQKDIENHSHIETMRLPEEIKSKLKTFDPKYFRVTRLFADLKNAPIYEHLDSEKTTINLNSQLQKSFCDLLHQFLKDWTKGHTTAFHLGFIPVQKPGKSVRNKDEPFDFTPTDVTTSISRVYDKEGNAQLVLNYLMMTKHNEAPINKLLYDVKKYNFKDAYLRIAESQFIENYFTNRLRKTRKLDVFTFSHDDLAWLANRPIYTKDTYRHSITVAEKRDLTESEHNTGSLKFLKSNGDGPLHLKVISETAITRILKINQQPLLNGTANSVYTWELTPLMNKLEMKWIKAGHGEKINDEANNRIKEYQSSSWPWWRRFGDKVKSYLYNFEEHPGRVSANFPRIAATANPIIKIPIAGVFTINNIDMLSNIEANAGHLCLDLKVDFNLD